MAAVLIVDDEDIVLATLKRLLGRDGMQATTVSSAKAALTLLARELPDLLIIDIKMPEMDGLTLLSEVRTKYGKLPVVMCTGFATPELKDEAFEKGTDYFIAKPFEAEEMINTVRKGIGLS